MVGQLLKIVECAVEPSHGENDISTHQATHFALFDIGDIKLPAGKPPPDRAADARALRASKRSIFKRRR